MSEVLPDGSFEVVTTTQEPGAARPAAVETDRKRTMLFCVSCFAAEHDGGSWGGGLTSDYCANCGAGGSSFPLPLWAVEEIRRNASFVGRLYYPSEDDRERAVELAALRATINHFPGRTAERYTDRTTGVEYWVVEQRLSDRRRVSQMVRMLEAPTEADAIEWSRTRLPFVPATP